MEVNGKTHEIPSSQVGQPSALGGVTTPPHWDCVREEVGASESSKSRSMNLEVWVLGFVFNIGSGQISDFSPRDCPEVMRMDAGGSTIRQI